MSTLTYEFIVPSAVWLVDAAEWPPIALQNRRLPMRLEKPIPGGQLVAPLKGATGNEGLVVDYTVMHVAVDVPEGASEPEWSEPYAAVQDCFMWIRAAGGQYWFGVLMSGTDSITRGSILRPDGSWGNFGATRTPIVGAPLSREVWEYIGREMNENRLPSIPELLFCDAMLSVRDNDCLQATIRLGIVCELELNAFVDDLLGRQTDGVKKLYTVARPQFDWKLKNLPGILGAQSYYEHHPKFAAILVKLYELRGSAVHRATCFVDETDHKTGKPRRVPVDFSHVSTFMFAVGDFLRWTKEQRLRLGFPTSRVAPAALKYTIGPQRQ